MAGMMEERIARREGAYEQIRDRLNGIDVRLGGIDHTIETFRTHVDQRFTWLTGVVIGTWITTILTILFHH